MIPETKVRRLIRDADPLGPGQLRGSARQPDARALLAELTASPVGVDVAESRARPVWRVRLAVAAVVTLVAGLAVGVWAPARRSDDTASTAPDRSTSISVSSWVRELAAAAPLPSSARRLAVAEPTDPDAVPQPAPESQAAFAARYASSQSVDSVATYVRTHLPRGWQVRAESSSGPKFGVDTSIELDIPSRHDGGLVGLVSIGISRTGNGSAITVHAQGFRSLRRSDQQTRGSSGPASVTVTTRRRSGSPTVVHKELGTAAARGLARSIDATPPAYPRSYLGFRSCPIPVSSWTITVAARAWTLTVQSSSCSSEAEVDGFALDGSDQLAKRVIVMSGLPADYLTR